MILKINLSKAFDRVNWLYIRILLTHLGFPYPFIKWIMCCITNILYSVLINGSASPSFHAERGLRQSCPLSHLLFLLIIEGLSRTIGHEHRQGQIRGIKITEACIVTHLLFVDNVLVFLGGDIGAITSLHRTLATFLKAKGMVLNEASLIIATGCSQHEESLALPKSWGGWRIKRLDILSKALAAKLGWKLLNNNSLWTKVVVTKYISPSNTFDWIRQDQRNTANISIIWKAVISTKALIQNGLTWRIRSGPQVQLGLDPWVGCGNAHMLSEELRAHLSELGFTNISHITNEEHSSMFQQAWKIEHDLNLPQLWQRKWRELFKALIEAHIRILEGDDELIWAFSRHVVYSPRIGHQVLMDPYKPPSSELWWRHLWKLKAAPRTKLLMWSILRNKVPIGANLMKRSFLGPFWCYLYKSGSEDTNHLFLHCPSTQELWSSLLISLSSSH
eukprot:PITA_07121